MQRIMIIGAPGSGKSTAAQLIGARLDLPVYHIDRDVNWLPNWQERPLEGRIKKAEEIAARDRWVFEGSFSRTYATRLARADMLIWLDTPLALRLFRVTRRALSSLGQTRPDMADGCEERLSMLPEFIWFILRTARRSSRKSLDLYTSARLQKHRLRSARAVNAFVSGLPRAPAGSEQH